MVFLLLWCLCRSGLFFFSSRIRHTICALVTGVQTCALPICIFPWYSEGQPILWWSPDPRMVFRTDRVRLSSRFRRSLRGSRWQVRADTAFEKVIAACADVPRAGKRRPWITPAMRDAYVSLHRLGRAHAVAAQPEGRPFGETCVSRVQ